MKGNSALHCDVLDFRYIASVRRHSASKMTGVENQGQSSGWVGLGSWLHTEMVRTVSGSPIPVLTGLDVEQLHGSRSVRYSTTQIRTRCNEIDTLTDSRRKKSVTDLEKSTRLLTTEKHEVWLSAKRWTRSPGRNSQVIRALTSSSFSSTHAKQEQSLTPECHGH